MEYKSENDMLYTIYENISVNPTRFNLDYNTGVSFNNGSLDVLYNQETDINTKLELFDKYLVQVQDSLTIIRKIFPDNNWYLFENKLTNFCESNKNVKVFVALCKFN